MSSRLSEFTDLATEYYPGSKRIIDRVRHPNRHTDEPLDPDRWDAKPKTLSVGGVMTEFFGIGQLAQALGGRRPVTIRKWERLGLIPKATYSKPSANGDVRGDRRLYTRDQVEGLIKIAHEEGLLHDKSAAITRTHFTARAIQLFKELEG